MTDSADKLTETLLETQPWSLAEFRQIRLGLPDEVLKPLCKICNSALRNGLTREQVADVFVDLAKRYPDALPVHVVIEALSDEIRDVRIEDVAVSWETVEQVAKAFKTVEAVTNLLPSELPG